jgi:hypothetical protein
MAPQYAANIAAASVSLSGLTLIKSPGSRSHLDNGMMMAHRDSTWPMS